MDNPETQAILGTRHRTKTKKKKEWTTQSNRQYWAQDTGRRQINKRMDNPETHAI